MKKLTAGSVAVGAIVLCKLALKAGFVAAIFGSVSYANTEYEMSVDHVKQDCAHFTAEKRGQLINQGLVFQNATVDEANKAIVYEYTMDGINSAALNRVSSDALKDAAKQDKAYSVDGLKKETDFRTLFHHGWTVEYRYLTTDGTVAEDYRVTQADFL
ncbi:hypothetical protein HA41_16975 [Pantoea conspicua]|uniref:Uncharacterized protein n=1 Tax=Pantoea conspicua TaxID=472705 RepID=A0A1X1BSA2_9GAMM|nr:hypothetical protein [Pantoea conspicua]ORM51047.1 hypothetical protein HA41_16975 [Pantoea conspicua]